MFQLCVVCVVSDVCLLPLWCRKPSQSSIGSLWIRETSSLPGSSHPVEVCLGSADDPEFTCVVLVLVVVLTYCASCHVTVG